MARQLMIHDGFQKLVMPDWFKDLVKLGRILGNWDKTQGRLVVALACPTSRFAATAISFGILWAESEKIKNIEREVMFSKLNQIKIGDYLSIRANSKQVIGRYLSLVSDNKLHLGGSRYLISKIDELHEVKSFETPKDSKDILKPSEIAAAAIYWLADESGPISGQVVELEQHPFIGRNPPKDTTTIQTSK